ncbi:Ni/Co efflux regulator RcnB [Luteibacter rhizovicinus]|uniref:Ni/Co efflux regulator RcnB n=1 Tax=Luteibacter rhizovicinus TaxID=242606 RepID=A0A4R3YM73_9GAMM|nr:RcnB family protein [Luteibacter rhizovicinus]TCV92164.1 Ni/Co efflux regulator RcnB [Luteibacter rhizovicinus]
MSILRTALASLALCVAAVSVANAQPRDDDHGRDHDRHGYDRRDDRRDDRRHDRRYDDRGWRHDGYAHRPPPGYYYNRPPPPRYYGHYGHWERGHRYDGPRYIVYDYRGYRLRPPPRGYHWVRSDNNDFLLVAIATGVILDIATR